MSTAESSRNVALVLALITYAVALLAGGSVLTRSIKRPLDQVVAVLDASALGDMLKRVNIASQGRVRSLGGRCEPTA